jgi:hypothetical protein
MFVETCGFDSIHLCLFYARRDSRSAGKVFLKTIDMERDVHMCVEGNKLFEKNLNWYIFINFNSSAVN